MIDLKNAQFSDVVPDTVGEAMLDFVCQKAIPTRPRK